MSPLLETAGRGGCRAAGCGGVESGQASAALEAPCRDAKSRAACSKPLAGAVQRQEFRGREADREKAVAAPQKRGIDPARGREQLRCRIGGRAQLTAFDPYDKRGPQ